jgi:hypothetical protein
MNVTFRVAFDPMQLDLKKPVAPITTGIARIDNVTSASYTDSAYSIGDHKITAIFTTPLTGSAIVAELPFEILMPTANVAPLRLIGANFGSSNASLGSTRNGAITIEQCDTTDRLTLTAQPITVIQSSPNPFSSHTSIAMQIGLAGHVTMSLYNALGVCVMTPFDADLNVGQSTVEIDGTTMTPGVYRAVTIWSLGGRIVRDERNLVVTR